MPTVSSHLHHHLCLPSINYTTNTSSAESPAYLTNQIDCSHHRPTFRSLVFFGNFDTLVFRLFEFRRKILPPHNTFNTHLTTPSHQLTSFFHEQHSPTTLLPHLITLRNSIKPRSYLNNSTHYAVFPTGRRSPGHKARVPICSGIIISSEKIRAESISVISS